MFASNCPRCGKLFNKISSPICVTCEAEEERIFLMVREYIEKNKNATVSEVVQATGVSLKKIQRYLKEGRIEATDGMEGALRCSSCGASIPSGRMCKSCIEEVEQNAQDMKKNLTAKNDETAKKGPRMHTR